jgi:hypothetical protein
MQVSGIVGNCKPKYQFRTCDGPETGGIGGNLNKKVNPFVLEERAKVYDWKTGEWKYKDEIKNPFAKY